MSGLASQYGAGIFISHNPQLRFSVFWRQSNRSLDNSSQVFELVTGDYLFDPKPSDEYTRDEVGRFGLFRTKEDLCPH